MRRMLDPKEAGGSLPSTIQFDENGNRTASKDVKVDGKLKLKSLVSASNPDGDITKELGGGGSTEKLYCHCIEFSQSGNSKGGRIILNYYSKKKDMFTYDTFMEELSGDKHVACSGYIHDGDNYFTPFYLQLSTSGPFTEIYVRYMDTVRNAYDLTNINTFIVRDNVSEVN